MHEFVFPTVGREAAEAIDHVPTNAAANPNVAVYDPHDVTLGFAVSAAHVADLGIWAKIVGIPIFAREIGVLLFDQDLSIKTREVGKYLLQNRESGIGA